MRQSPGQRGRATLGRSAFSDLRIQENREPGVRRRAAKVANKCPIGGELQDIYVGLRSPGNDGFGGPRAGGQQVVGDNRFQGRPCVIRLEKGGKSSNLNSQAADIYGAPLGVATLDGHMRMITRADPQKSPGAQKAGQPTKLCLVDGSVHAGGAVPL